MFDNCTTLLMKEPSPDVSEIYDWYIFPNGIETMDFTLRITSENHAWKYETKRKEQLRNGWMFMCGIIIWC